MKRIKKGAQVFRPLVDWWVVILILLVIVILSSAIPLLLVVATSPILMAGVIVFLILTILYIADIGFFSYYLLEDDCLSIVSNIRHLTFPYRDMTEIKPSNFMGLISFAGRKRFALSTHCFAISLRKGYWKTITVSPVERDYFLNALISHIDRERSSRATVERSKK